MIRSLKSFKGYDIVNLNDEHLFIEHTNDTGTWEMLADHDTILNVPCLAAYKDSTIAFYAPSIPVPAGPFGTFALPGTILKIFNLRYHYLVEAISIVNEIPEIACSKRMLYMTDTVLFRQRQKDLRDSKEKKTIKWFGLY